VCAVCSSPAPHKCAGCKRVSYCSPAHQKEDWKAHKKVCPRLAQEAKDADKRLAQGGPSLYMLHFYKNQDNNVHRISGVTNLRIMESIEETLASGSSPPLGYVQKYLCGVLLTLEQFELPSPRQMILVVKLRGLLGAAQMIRLSSKQHGGRDALSLAEASLPLAFPKYKPGDFSPKGLNESLGELQKIAHANGWVCELIGSLSTRLYLPRDFDVAMYLSEHVTVESVIRTLNLSHVSTAYRVVGHNACKVLHCTLNGISFDITFADGKPNCDTNQGGYFTSLILASVASVPDFLALVNYIRFLLGGRNPDTFLGSGAGKFPSAGVSLFSLYYFKLCRRAGGDGRSPALIIPTNKVCDCINTIRELLESFCGFLEYILAIKTKSASAGRVINVITLHASGGGEDGSSLNPGNGRITESTRQGIVNANSFDLRLEMPGYLTGMHFFIVSDFDKIGKILQGNIRKYLDEGIVVGADLVFE
jgi:hypothetical protein